MLRSLGLCVVLVGCVTDEDAVSERILVVEDREVCDGLDNDGDGRVDEDVDVTWVRIDNDADGNWDSGDLYSRDDRGQIVFRLTDAGAGWTEGKRYVFGEDPFGRFQWDLQEGFEVEGDRYLATFRNAISWDARERTVRKRSFRHGWDLVERVRFDVHGRELSRTVDQGNDGKIDFGHVVAHMADGTSVRVQTDADGAPTQIVEERVNEDGHRVYEGIDIDADGVIDFEQLQTWEGGRLTQVVEDRGADELPHVLAERYDEEGRLIEAAEYGPNGILQHRRLIRDDAGRLVRLEIDRGVDGVVDEVEWWERSADGRRVRQLVDRDVDGVADAITTKLLDGALRTIRTVTDEDGDGRPDRIIEREYRCPL